MEAPRAVLSGLTTPLLHPAALSDVTRWTNPSSRRFVLGTGMAAAIGLGILSAWAWSTPEVSIWLRAVLPLLTIGIVALEVMLALALRRKARGR